MSEERDQARQKYGALFFIVRGVLERHDPMHIGATPDEYEPEVVEVLPGLAAASTEEDVLSVVHTVFKRMFAPVDVGPRARFAPVASEIWRLTRNRRSHGEDSNRGGGPAS